MGTAPTDCNQMKEQEGVLGVGRLINQGWHDLDYTLMMDGGQ